MTRENMTEETEYTMIFDACMPDHRAAFLDFCSSGSVSWFRLRFLGYEEANCEHDCKALHFLLRVLALLTHTNMIFLP